VGRWKYAEGERLVPSFSDLWVDLCWCPGCADYAFHVELAEEAVRDGYVPWCPDCGSRMQVVHRDEQGERLH
jgi:hypothetical protein